MQITKAQFLLGATSLEQCPPTDIPEVAFIGRSNVGKSSLINTLMGRKNLARISNTPGKTREINFYLINNDLLYLADLPGYGFAKVSRKDRTLWGAAIEHYLLNRPNLRLVVQLIDNRHEPTELDEEIMFWLAENGITFANILTKADKLSKNRQHQNLERVKEIQADMNIEVPVLMSSSRTRQGLDDILLLIEEFTLDHVQ